ncbi:glycoside hydrolase domain-containing protein [Micromonospora sp. NPDC007230]|uniref:glycoside hydrolase domain-containing protein n=1 Tax=Micromonospora sp. NPDC007230 TaxID=3364237 RepID=UPI00368A695A
MKPTFSRPVLRGAARRALAAVATATLGAGLGLTVTSSPAHAAISPQPGTYTGLGFDACTAPTSAQMQAWRQSSPYRAVIIYFGGINRGCRQPALTADWVAAQTAAGWHLVPVYVGLQAPCLDSADQRMDPDQAQAQGRSQADDAVLQARSLGLPRESVLIYDMEDYDGGDAACTTAVNTFISAWTARLHDHGYFSGFYSSLARGVADQVAAYDAPQHVRPDYLDFARWDNVATVSDPRIPASYWSPKRRMKQHVGPHDETWGGVTINIDGDYLDVAPLPATPVGDFNGNGWSDLMYRDRLTGELYLQPGNGTTLAPRISLGRGWSGLDEIVRAGNFDRAGGEDVIARDAVTGDLWLYPGTGTGTFSSRVRVGTGWADLREITPIGDYNRDGYPDLVAVTTTGALYLYPGRGNTFGSRVLLASSGWTSLDELTGGSDLDGDGYVDLIARQKKTGDLYRYPVTTAGKLGAATKVGSGWAGRRDLTQVGDFDRDGRADLVAIDSTTHLLYRYRWLGSGWSAPIMLSKPASRLQDPLL